MRHIKSFLVIIFFTSVLFSCTGNSSSENKTNTSDVKTSSAETNNSEDKNLSGTDGIFSYTVKGKHVVAGNYVQQSNLFINDVSNDAANGMVQIKVTCESSSVFNFTIANSGTTTITNYSPSLGNFADKNQSVFVHGRRYL